MKPISSSYEQIGIWFFSFFVFVVVAMIWIVGSLPGAYAYRVSEFFGLRSDIVIALVFGLFFTWPILFRPQVLTISAAGVLIVLPGVLCMLLPSCDAFGEAGASAIPVLAFWWILVEIIYQIRKRLGRENLLTAALFGMSPIIFFNTPLLPGGNYLFVVIYLFLVPALFLFSVGRLVYYFILERKHLNSFAQR